MSKAKYSIWYKNEWNPEGLYTSYNCVVQVRVEHWQCINDYNIMRTVLTSTYNPKAFVRSSIGDVAAKNLPEPAFTMEVIGDDRGEATRQAIKLEDDLRFRATMDYLKFKETTHANEEKN